LYVPDEVIICDADGMRQEELTFTDKTTPRQARATIK